MYKGVYNGEYAVGLTYEDPCVTLIKDGATNIKVVYPVEGTVFLPAQIGIVKNAKNVENAKRSSIHALRRGAALPGGKHHQPQRARG